MQAKVTGVDTPANVAANGYPQKGIQVTLPARPGPVPLAVEASGLPLVNPLVDLAPTALVRGGQYQSLIRNTGQSYDYRGPTQAERDARTSFTSYPTSTMINSRMEEAIRDARELAQLQQEAPVSGGALVPL
jgi:hypothetical protein